MKDVIFTDRKDLRKSWLHCVRFPDDRRGVTADGDVVEAWNDVTVWGDWGDTKVAILFVACFLLLKQGSNKNVILKAEKCFFGCLYWFWNVLRNVHTLVHLGRLNNHNSYSFKYKNGINLKSIPGTRNDNWHFICLKITRTKIKISSINVWRFWIGKLI